MIVEYDVLLDLQIWVALHNKYSLAFASLDLVVPDDSLTTDVAAKGNICFYIIQDMVGEDVSGGALLEKNTLAIILRNQIASRVLLRLVLHYVLFEADGVFENVAVVRHVVFVLALVHVILFIKKYRVRLKRLFE